jgi:hypothetical protein
MSEFEAYLVMKNKPKASKINDLRARSTCEQDQFVCGILHVSSWRYGCIVTFFWCINDDCNLCVWFCISRDLLVWLSLCSTIFYMITYSLASLKKIKTTGLANMCLFWCNLCVWFCISRDMLVWLSLCSTIFCMIYLLTCKAWTSRRGLANPCLFWCNLFVILHILPITKAMRVH